MVTMRITPRWITPALMAAVAASTVVLAPPSAAQPDDPRVDALLQERLVNPRIGDDVGMVVLDGATGAVVSAHDADALMLPASNMKIITAVTVLATLGSEAQFTTRVRSGPVAGELVLEGGGDPLLTTGDLQAMARKVAKGLAPDSVVVVRVDDDLFPATGRGPGWTKGYLPYVAAPVEALARLGDYSPDPSTNAAKVFTQRLRGGSEIGQRHIRWQPNVPVVRRRDFQLHAGFREHRLQRVGQRLRGVHVQLHAAAGQQPHAIHVRLHPGRIG